MADPPIVLGPSEGEVLSDAPRPSRIKVAREELLLLDVSSPPGSRGASPHVHREHADAFFVIEGELLSHVAGEERRLTPGSFVLAPPGVVHGFEVGPDGARYLNLHTPGAAYAKLARARRDGVEFDPAEGDSFPPPEDGGLPVDEALVHHADGDVVKAARPELSFLVLEFRPGGGVDPHFHKGHSDSFFVLEGELEIHAGDEVVSAVAGTYVLSPPHVVHWFRNVSDAPARFVNIHTPGGFAEYREKLGQLRAQGIEPDRSFFEGHDIFDL